MTRPSPSALRRLLRPAASALAALALAAVPVAAPAIAQTAPAGQAPGAVASPVASSPVASSPVAAPLIGEDYARAAAPFLNFMRDYLWRPVGAEDGQKALVEVERASKQNTWYWIDDNAKALEALTIPAAYARYHDLADSLRSFVANMSDGPLILRRVARPDLTVVEADPAAFRFHTGLLSLHGDLRKGEIFVSYRFADGRDADALKLSGNWLRFDLNGQTMQFDVEDNIVDARIDRRGEQAVLSQRSEIRVAEKPVAAVTYAYTVDPASTFLRVEITVEALNGATLDNVRLTGSMDQMSGLSGSVNYPRLCVARPGAGPAASPECHDKPADGRAVIAEGAVDWFSLVQLGSLGFSYAAHTRPDDGGQLIELVAEGSHDGRYHWVYPVYGLKQVTAGAPGHVGESKLLTSGGLYQSMELYDAVTRPAVTPYAVDYSVSYDYGAELNALACQYMFARHGAYEPLRSRDDPMFAGVPAWFERHYRYFTDNFLTERPDDAENPFPYLFGRGVAFAIMANDCMHRATGETKYIENVKSLVEIVLKTQRQEGGAGLAGLWTPGVNPASQRQEGAAGLVGLFRCNGSDSYIDCQAAMLLGLARASLMLDDPRLNEAIARGIGAIRVEAWQAAFTNTLVPRGTGEVKMRVTASHTEVDGLLWAYKSGLLARALAAVQLAADQGRLTLDPVTEWKARELSDIATDYIRHTALRRRVDAVELKSSIPSSETNSETQAWSMLGLLPIDRYVAAVPPPAQ